MSRTYDTQSAVNPNTATGKFLEKINIVKNLQQNQELEGEKLKKIFIDAKKTGVYNYFRAIEPQYLLMYFIMILLIFTYVDSIDYSMKHIVSLIITILIIWYLNEMRKSQSISRMQELEIKMLSIFPKPQFFYIDSGVIELVFSVIEYKKYNAPVFNKLVLLLDTYLKQVLDVEKSVINCHETYETMQNLKRACLNNFSSLLFSIPSDKQSEGKLTKATDTLHYLLNFHLENVRNICNKKYESEDITIHSKYIEPANNPRAFDHAYNNRFDLF